MTSWNVNRKPARPPGVSRCVGAQADLDLARPSRGAVAELDAPRAGAAELARRARRRAPPAAAARRAIGRPTAGADGTPVIVSAARLNVRIRPRVIGRRQAARQAVDHVLVERLQVRDLGRRLLERAPADRRLFGERAAEQRDREEPEHVEADGVRATDRGGSGSASAASHGSVQQPGAVEVLRQHQADVEHGAERRRRAGRRAGTGRCCAATIGST